MNALSRRFDNSSLHAAFGRSRACLCPGKLMKALLIAFAVLLGLLAWMAPDRADVKGTEPSGVEGLP